MSREFLPRGSLGRQTSPVPTYLISSISYVDDVCAAPQANGELDGRYSEHSQLLERSICSMDVRAVGLHACAERACSFFSAAAGELEAHEEREVAIDEAAEQRVRGLRQV